MTDDWDDTVSALPGTLEDVLGPTQAYLVVVRGNNVGATFAVTGPDMVIGRAAGADLRLNDEGVSRFHCKLSQGPNGIVVEDLSSRNGTFCNGERVVPGMRPLAEGDRLQIGTHSVLRFTYVEGTAMETPNPEEQRTVVDAVTGLYGRRFFMDRLETEVSTAIEAKTPLALVILHIDRFDDEYMKQGAETADAVAVQIANHIRANVRKDDIVARLDPANFALLSRWASPGDTFMLAERLRKSVPHFEVAAASPQPTVSIGVASINELSIATAHDMVVAAGTAVHRARSQGGNRIVMCTQDLLQEPRNTAKV